MAPSHPPGLRAGIGALLLFALLGCRTNMEEDWAHCSQAEPWADADDEEEMTEACAEILGVEDPVCETPVRVSDEQALCFVRSLYDRAAYPDHKSEDFERWQASCPVDDPLMGCEAGLAEDEGPMTWICWANYGECARESCLSPSIWDFTVDAETGTFLAFSGTPCYGFRWEKAIGL